MIRPHSENFHYSRDDFDQMKSTLESLKRLGADGFVFGILMHPEARTQDTAAWVDIERNKELVALADGRPCTFHRAFDCIPEQHWDTALAAVEECGFRSILTSGGPSGSKATDCIDKLSSLHQGFLGGIQTHQAHQALDIIIGGGVRSTNIQSLWEQTPAQTFHSSALLPGSEEVSEEEVTRLKEALKNCALLQEGGPQCLR
ncbi:Copper homeostasis protein CutC [Penicillium argentinense]|uniref:Copper homeostasis protein cutC homolog n=1 Tax=Penicillium argentinense TaxID=1131581 RepID=A0A9W9FCZ2_9EURO|nr:Copper homeostasis protein CutC [Penicillium argentinense]KAJ5097841.1 Copper homeostasis protein CutC [Penicillium argentinense]